MKLVNLPRLLVWIGRPRDTPITYDDLVDAETRVFNAEEATVELMHDAALQREALSHGGDRLYKVLATIDTRDGTPLAEVVRTAREGWERQAIGESSNPFADFDACFGSLTIVQRNELALTRLDLIRKWETELSLREDKAGPDSVAAYYARGVLRGLGALTGSETL